jgi:hypothetical protein
VIGGIMLGYSCRELADAGTTRAGWLADLASPWIVAAFTVGLLAASVQPVARDRESRLVRSTVAGAVSGAIALLVATIAYYGLARTGGLDFGEAGDKVEFWSVVGLAAGATFGGAGAISRTATGVSRLLSVGVLLTMVFAELWLRAAA